MHLLFLDESGQLSERKFFALGGVALRDDNWHELRRAWQETLAAHDWPPGKEIKWHGIRTGEVPPALADAVVATLARAPVHCYVTLLDIELGLEQTPEFFGNDEDTYATRLMFLAERFQLLLESAGDVGMIVVDSRFREDDARLRRFFADLMKDGSPYSRLDRIVEGLFLGPSRHLDRPAVRRPRVRDHRRRRAPKRPGPRLSAGSSSPASRSIRPPASSTASGSSASRGSCAGRARSPGCSDITNVLTGSPRPPNRRAGDSGRREAPSVSFCARSPSSPWPPR